MYVSRDAMVDIIFFEPDGSDASDYIASWNFMWFNFKNQIEPMYLSQHDFLFEEFA